MHNFTVNIIRDLVRNSLDPLQEKRLLAAVQQCATTGVVISQHNSYHNKMESKQQGVAKYRSAKEEYTQGLNSPDAKSGSIAEHKDIQMIPGVDFSQEKAILREMEQDMEADDEFEKLKNTQTEVVPAVAPTKFAKNFVKGFRM